jgi:hypothetical protein
MGRVPRARCGTQRKRSPAPRPGPTGQRSLDEALGQIPPFRVVPFDQLDLPRPAPPLQGCLASPRRGYVIVVLDIDQSIDAILRCKSGNGASTVGRDAPDELRGHTDIERAVPSAREDVDRCCGQWCLHRCGSSIRLNATSGQFPFCRARSRLCAAALTCRSASGIHNTVPRARCGAERKRSPAPQNRGPLRQRPSAVPALRGSTDVLQRVRDTQHRSPGAVRAGRSASAVLHRRTGAHCGSGRARSRLCAAALTCCSASGTHNTVPRARCGAERKRSPAPQNRGPLRQRPSAVPALRGSTDVPQRVRDTQHRSPGAVRGGAQAQSCTAEPGPIAAAAERGPGSARQH